MKILLRAYNPDQPRDDGGKWTAGAYSSGGKYSGNRERIASAKDLDDNIHFEFPSRFEEVFGGRYSVKYKNAKNAINKHSSHTSALDDKSVRKAMDRAFKYAGIELQQDAMVYRGVNLPPEKVAEMLKSVDTKGRVYLQQNKNRYVPTTTRQQIANAFGNVQLKIFLPKGTRVLPIAEINGFEDEREVTLNRGARFRVVGGRTLKSGKKEFTLEYVGAVHNKKSQLGKLMGLLLSKISPDRRDHFGSDIEYIEIDDEVVHGEKEEGDFVELGIGEAADVDMEDDEDDKLARAFDPDQPRDDGGKWTAGAYGEGGKYESRKERIDKAGKIDKGIFNKMSEKAVLKEFAKEKGGTPPDGWITVKNKYDVEDFRYDVEESGLKVGDKLWESDDGVLHIQRKKPYTGAEAMVSAIQDHSEDTEIGSDTRKKMDKLYERMGVTLKKDSIVWRGIDVDEKVTRQWAKAADSGKRVYIQQAKDKFVPTSRSKSTAEEFGSVRLKIMLPKGTKVLPIGKMNGYGEDEVTLDRGAKFRIVGSEGHNKFIVELVSSRHQRKSALKMLLAGLLLKVEDEEDDVKPTKKRTPEQMRRRYGGDIAYVEIDGEVVYGDRKSPKADDKDEEPKPEWCMECDDEGVWHVIDTAEKGDRVHDYERAGYKKKKHCGKCGSTKNLIVHHKDHNHNNNRKGNHETICRTCHSKEHADQKRGKDGKYGSGTNKSFTAPSSATGGLQGYDLEGNRASRRAGVRLRPKRRHLAVSGTTGRAKIIPQGAKQ